MARDVGNVLCEHDWIIVPTRWKYVETKKCTKCHHETNEEVIRTYNEPDNRVKDHASGYEEAYKDFDIDNFIIERKKAK